MKSLNRINFSPLKETALLVLLTVTTAFAPVAYDYRFESSDSEFTMEVKRENQAVNLFISFSGASKIAHVTIEKSKDAANNFSRCGYVSFDEQQDDATITKRDNYPLSVMTDSYYRLRLNFKDGTKRIYPPVRLPSLAQ